MNRKSLLIVAAILLLGSAAVLFVSMQPNEYKAPAVTDQDLALVRASLKDTAPEIQQPQPIDPSRRVRLAIGSIGLGDETDRKVADLLLSQLSAAPSLEMVERQELEAVLKELQLSLSRLVRAGDAVRVGKLLRADWFLLGTPATVNGTNVAVIRVVDARTGIMRNAAMFPRNQTEEEVALKIASFIRETRQEAAALKSRTFLAIGAFQDVGLSSRQATLPANLRSQLIAAYQGSGVTMLEREFVSALLKELYLDLAGLTEESATNAPAMQSAYWLVDGAYQSYETSQLEVEVMLNVHRMFGRRQRFELREKPGDPLFRRVKEAINTAMQRDSSKLLLSRVSEVKAQLESARLLLELVEKRPGGLQAWVNYTSNESDSETVRDRRNIKEAILAAESALMLDPGNRQAKFILARCFTTRFEGRSKEASVLFRDLIDDTTEDHWTEKAKRALPGSLLWMATEAERQQWYESAANLSRNESSRKFFADQGAVAEEGVMVQHASTSDAEAAAERRLFRAIAEWESNVKRGGWIVDFHSTGLGKYAAVFGTNSALAASKLLGLLPRLQKASTNLAPHIFAGVLTFQVDTNAPIISEFEKTLDSLSSAGPSFKEDYYFMLLRSPVRQWAENRGLYRLSARLGEVCLNYQMQRGSIVVSDEHRIAVAYDLLRAQEWKKALELFQSYSNRPILMPDSGMWGRGGTIVFPIKQEVLCREKLGLHRVPDDREFEVTGPSMHLHGHNMDSDKLSFRATSGGLWIGLNEELLHMGFDLRTNSTFHPASDNAAPVLAICDGGSNIWVGTGGGGLFLIDKASDKIQQFTERDGLLINHIQSLDLHDHKLWIGYGNGVRGALGCLETETRKFESFVASLSQKPGTVQPPSSEVSDVRALSNGDVFCMVGSALLKCRPYENLWQPVTSGTRTTCYAAEGATLVEGVALDQIGFTVIPADTLKGSIPRSKTLRVMSYAESVIFQRELKTNGSPYKIHGTHYGAFPAIGELSLRNFSDGTNRRLLGGQPLPGPATAIALNRRDLWVGGMGFLALIDLDQDKIVKLAYIQARQVDSIQFGGGGVWVQFNKHIYRIPENLRTR